MGAARKLVMVHSDAGIPAADDALDLQRLRDALLARGAEIVDCTLGSDPDTLLDQLEAGAVPVMLRTAPQA